MENLIVDVKLWGDLVGSMVWDTTTGMAVFEYDSSFRRDGIELAPAYDLCFSYKPGGRWTGQHQLSLNGKQDDFTRQDLLTVGERMGIRRCNEIIEEVAEAVSCWKKIALDCGVKNSHIQEIEKSLLLF